MGFLEIIGISALWIAGTVALLYAAMFLLNAFVKGGLGVFALMAWVAGVIIVASVVAGVFVLGGMIL